MFKCTLSSFLQATDGDTHPDDRRINDFWDEKKKNNTRYFNQSKFRLSSFALSTDHSDRKSRVEIKVGITDYKVRSVY